jgi:hypothetical protein
VIRIWLLVVLITFTGCEPELEFQSVSLQIDVLNEVRQPVGDVSVFMDGQLLGITDGTGNLRTRLSGPEGRPVGVSIQCPEGSVPENGTSRDLLVRFLRPIGGGANVPLRVTFQCASRTRKSVLLVRADGQARLPVRALGQQVAVTDENGVVEVVLEGVPGEEIEVQLDTSTRPHLRPSMPSRRLAIPTGRQIFVFDQKFEIRKSRRKRKRQRRVLGPRRI